MKFYRSASFNLKLFFLKLRFAPLLLLFLAFSSCKKDAVDAASTKSMQASINDMASGLNTLQQIKFNEALYILKTFGVEADGETNELKALGKLLDGKKVPDIFALADQVAQKTGLEWSSAGPPSLGEMNIFASEEAKEFDPNDIQANALLVNVTNLQRNEVLGPQSLSVVPRLVDQKVEPVSFSGAGLEVIMEVSSGGSKISTTKNLMQDNNFKGFTLRFSSLPAQKIINGKIDIMVSVKTTRKTFKMSKIGIDVNSKALLMQAGDPEENPANTSTEIPEFNPDIPVNAPETSVAPAKDPKASVSKFLSNLSGQNFRAAYDAADNRNWGSFETFSNPNSGFGGVKNIAVKNLTTNSASASAASVNATYDIVDKDGKTTAVQVTFGLKNINGDWKISSYKIN